jgi:osmotically-inducible protein OsmY
LYGLAGLAALAMAMPAFGQQMRSGSTGGNIGSSFGSSSSGSSNFGSSSFASSSSTGFGSGSSSSTTGSTQPTAASILATSTLSQGNVGTGAGGGFGQTSVTSGVSSANQLGSFYANPLAAGMTNVTRSTFGQPLYSSQVIASTTNSLSGRTGLGNTGTLGFAGVGSTTTPAAATYSATLSFAYPPRAVPSRLQLDVEQVLARSSALTQSRDIRVAMDGAVVVLQGKAANEHDRRLAEGLVSLSPGVRAVRNEIQIPTEERLPAPAVAP